MDSKQVRELMEAYLEVYAPEEQEEIQEAVKGESSERRKALAAERRSGVKPLPKKEGEQYANYKMSQMAYAKRKRMGEEVDNDIFDEVLEFLQAEGYAETLEEAEWLMANVIDEEAIAIVIGEAIYSEKGKAKAAEMIAKRSTPSGRAKSGKGANVAQIRQIRGSGRGRFDREGLGGTPMTPTMAKNPIKKQNYDGTGNKAARRAGLTPTREKPNAWKEDFEFWVNGLVEEGYDLSNYTWDEMYEFYLGEEELDEAEGSYGKTPKATAAYAALARSRSGRGSGKKLASKHAERSQKIAPGRSGKRSTPPRFTSGDREKMTQSDRDYLRGRSEYGHVDYDPDYDGQASGPGGKPKGKKLERQRKTGVSAESFDYVNEAQAARGDKRREDFEKWYRANVR